ncbi:hypothetical protein BAT_2073 [Bacillus pumilus ATCC 7061]|nr:hypothetical protein BAT_2073 [Bacillus pumilus ATCC 7061]
MSEQMKQLLFELKIRGSFSHCLLLMDSNAFFMQKNENVCQYAGRKNDGIVTSKN